MIDRHLLLAAMLSLGLGAAQAADSPNAGVGRQQNATPVPTNSSIQFPPQTVATISAPTTVKLLNSAASSVGITSVVAPPDVAVAHQCVAVPTGSSCGIQVSFAPVNFAGTVMATQQVTRTLEVYAEGAPVPHIITLTGTAEKSLVTHFYRSILRREPDAGGKAYWNGEAVRVGTDGADPNEAWYALASQFFSSTEYQAMGRNDRGYVTDLYNTFFGREPDFEGLNHWIGQLAAGMPRGVVRTGFMLSTEFATFTTALYGKPVVRAESNMVMDFYRGLLGRLPDSVGYASWIARFRKAQCSGAAAVQAEVEAISSAFANSGEYAGRLRGNADYVSDLYDAFLRRGGDLAGVNFWIAQLAAGSRSRDNLRQEFMKSAEFTARIAAVTAESCIPTS